MVADALMHRVAVLAIADGIREQTVEAQCAETCGQHFPCLDRAGYGHRMGTGLGHLGKAVLAGTRRPLHRLARGLIR